jgi:hypothetical protein
MDIVEEAKRRRLELLNELSEIENFLRSAERLAQRLTTNLQANVRRRVTNFADRAAPKHGAVFETATVVKDYMKKFGEGLRTRDLVEVVQKAGIHLGGRNEVATLSARLSVSQQFDQRDRQWFIRRIGDEEAVGALPSKLAPTASRSSNIKEIHYGTALDI